MEVNKKLLPLLKQLWRVLDTYIRLKLVIAIFLMVASALMELISIGLIVPFIGALQDMDGIRGRWPVVFEFINKPGQDIRVTFLILFLAGVFISTITRMYSLWYSSNLSYKIGSVVTCNLYENIINKPYKYFIENSSSEIIGLISKKSNNISHNTIFPIMVLLSSFIMVLVVTSVIMIINPIITTVVLIIMVSMQYSVIRLVKFNITKIGITISKITPENIKILQETFLAIRNIKLDKLTGYYSDLFRKNEDRLTTSQVNLHLIGNLPKYILETIALFGFSISVLYFSNSYTLDKIIPVMGAIALALQKLLPLFQQSYASWVSIKGNQEALREIVEVITDVNPSYVNNMKINFNNRIEIVEGAFKYETGGKKIDILDKVNLTIYRGSRVAIIGETGSGKSTLIDVLMGLIELTGGRTLIDGKNVPLSSNEWQKNIAHVPQRIYLSNESIISNIAFGQKKEHINIERAVNCAKICELEGLVSKHELKTDLRIGEMGGKLSGGQRQRVGIARALYKNANILILDEATNALDEQTEKKVLDNIISNYKNLTIIIVTHNKNILNYCDRIIEIKNNKLNEYLAKSND